MCDCVRVSEGVREIESVFAPDRKTAATPQIESWVSIDLILPFLPQQWLVATCQQLQSLKAGINLLTCLVAMSYHQT